MSHTSHALAQPQCPTLATHWQTKQLPCPRIGTCDHCLCILIDMVSTAPLTLPTLPIFTSAGTAVAQDLLAAAAGNTCAPLTTVTGLGSGANSLLSRKGPFNPAASLPPKIVKRILELDFLEMSEITMDPDLVQAPGRPPPPARLPITDISQWLERFSLMAATLASRFPEKAPELFAYQATIIRAERNYETGRWVAYDRQFRREALTRKDLNWSTPDPHLFSEAFTGRARSIPRCNFCLQDDHTGQYCPKNPENSWPGWLSGPSPWQHQARPSPAPARPSLNPPQGPKEICRRFNEGKCKLPQHRCRYLHACRECGEVNTHPGNACPSPNSQKAWGRSRSPYLPQAQPAWQSGPR